MWRYLLPFLLGFTLMWAFGGMRWGPWRRIAPQEQMTTTREIAQEYVDMGLAVFVGYDDPDLPHHFYALLLPLCHDDWGY